MTIDFSNDFALKKELEASNEQALVYLMDRYHKPLCLYIFSLSNNYELSQDIVQNVFVKIWEERSRIQSIINLKSFLYKSAYNAFLNQLRKDKRMLTIEDHHMKALHQIIENEDDFFLQKQIKLVKQEIEKLPARCRETFLLSKKEGLTTIEIADYMNVSTRTVEGQITKAFKILREKLKDKIKPVLFFLFGLDSNNGKTSLI